MQSSYPVSRRMRELVNELSGHKRVIFSHIWKVQNEFLQENLDGTFGMLGMLYIGYKFIYPVSRGMGEWVIKPSWLKRVILRHIWKVQNEFLQENLDGTFGMLGMLCIGYKVFILCPGG